jgi:Ca-activated chloride channel family protein
MLAPVYAIYTIVFILIISVLFAAFFYYFHGRSKGWLYSDITLLTNFAMRGKAKYKNLPAISLGLAAVTFLAALVDPKIEFKPFKKEYSGTAAYFILDQSSSMLRSMEPPFNPIYSYQEGKGNRIGILKMVTTAFIRSLAENISQHNSTKGRDLLGLVSFARASHQICPLTLDYKVILENLAELKTISDEDADGTAMGYALFKTACWLAVAEALHHVKYDGKLPLPLIKNKGVIFVTDGYPQPHPEDEGHPWRSLALMHAAEFASQHHIQCYIVNIDPRLKQPEFAMIRSELEQVTSKTGGNFYIAESIDHLTQIYSEIWQELNKKTAENSVIESNEFHSYPYFILFALILVLSAIIFDVLWLRRVF